MILQEKVKNGQALLVGGAALIVVDGLAGPALPELVEGILYFVALCLLLVGLVLWAKKKREFDERFQLYRLKATRLSAVVGMILLGIWFAFDAFENDIIHWQILVIFLAMAGAKIGMMAYFQKYQ